MTMKRKLIEVSLPLEEINAQSAREKSIRHGHPSTLHLWWARRPLATARAVLFAQLVDDPSNFVDDYRQEAIDKGYEDPDSWAEHRVKQERQRLFDLIIRMVNWDNLGDEALFDAVRAEIMTSTGGNPPAILDPFAGGGTIPLEAQRLGLEAHASDLNPVAVLINKALIEIPPRFSGRDPAFPGAAAQRNAWPKASGLAEDVRRYGEWIRAEAERRIGYLYPKAKLPDGSEATVIAWIWARTVACANPACGIEMPLVRSWWLGKKTGKEAYVVPKVLNGRVTFDIGSDPNSAPRGESEGTVHRSSANCVSCGTAASMKYIKSEGNAGRIGSTQIAVVAEGQRRRIYLPPHSAETLASIPPLRHGVPEEALASNSQYMGAPLYGLKTFGALFTARQLVFLETLLELVAEVRDEIAKSATNGPVDSGLALKDGGTGQLAYAEAVATYLVLSVSKSTNVGSSLTSWMSDRGAFRETFARQAISMVWDFAESNALGTGGGTFASAFEKAAMVLDELHLGPIGVVEQRDAATREFGPRLVSTDPPYYDNVPYSDISDFFYVWLRRGLKDTFPDLFGTALTPKNDELVANRERQGGKEAARDFFELGFSEVFKSARADATSEYPIAVYYAFKQTETKGDEATSTGWETILQSMVRAGWLVTATWPVRTEGGGRIRALGSNALASSVVLALRPRPIGAPITDRRGFIASMKRELGPALRELQQGGIAPVDLPQAAIGPGMAVFSRYAKVIESDGTEMNVRSALARINEVLDELLTEQEGDFDAPTRFALAWYRGHGYDPAPYGEAEDLARARGTAVAAMERIGILSARAGKVQIYRPNALPADYDVLSDDSTSAWEALHHAMRILDTSGFPVAGQFLQTATQRADGAVDLDLVKELAYLLFQVAEKNGWAKDAFSFNAIASSWGDLLNAGRAAPALAPDTSATLDFGELE